MLQHWASEGEFYTGSFVLHNFIESVTFASCTLTLLNLNELVMFACCAWALGDQIDIRLYIYRSSGNI